LSGELAHIERISEGESVVFLERAIHVPRDEEAYREAVRISLDTAAETQSGIALALSENRHTGSQAWPVGALRERLATIDDTDRSTPNQLLVALDQGLDVRTIDDPGWIRIDDWDAVRRLMARVEKPWGYEELWAITKDYAGKILFIRAGESLSLQYHEEKSETILVESGRMLLRAGRASDALQEILLEPGMSYAIPAGLIHQMEAVEDCTVIEVSTPHLADVVRLSDRYGRA
jgi:mannose-6-phosphate isomerase-like protein (cupin superfamily)